MNSIDLSKQFLDDNYSSESLLASTRDQKLSLGELRDRVIQHQQDLNQNFLKLFNQNYDRFYKLSHIVTCLSEPIQGLVEPLQSFHGRLEELCRSHAADVEMINSKLNDLENSSKDKLLAKNLITLIGRHDRIEKKMDSIEWSAIAPETIEFLSRSQNHDMTEDGRKEISIDQKLICDLLERLSIELHYLNCEVRAMSPAHNELLSIKKSLEARLLARQRQLSQAGVKCPSVNSD